LGSGTIGSGAGALEFAGGYPTDGTAAGLREVLTFNRAIEMFLSQMPMVSWYRVWKGVAEAYRGTANQMVIWETLMDAQTLLLTGNTETVYGLAALDLKRDGPTVVEVPPNMLGGISDMSQHEITNIGPTGPDKGNGGKFLILPPSHSGQAPAGYMIFKSPTYRVVLGLRGFLVEGKPDHASALMRNSRIYPLAQAGNPPPQTFVNGSGKEIDTIFCDTYQFFEDLADIVAHEPPQAIAAQDRFPLAALGIEKHVPFMPNTERRSLLDKAARVAGAIARVNAFASTDPERIAYADRRWEYAFIGGSASWDAQGYVNTDRRAAFAYIAIGMSPAMVEKIVGGGSQYLWTPRDANGAYLDGAKTYRLQLPANIPVKNFWSVVIYDAESRSLLRNGKPFPSVSVYSSPTINADGSVDVHFGPEAPAGREKNWIKTVPGKGWFPLLRLYGPLEAYFDKSWRPGDIEEQSGLSI
jgi:hypothetical protein